MIRVHVPQDGFYGMVEFDNADAFNIDAEGFLHVGQKGVKEVALFAPNHYGYVMREK